MDNFTEYVLGFMFDQSGENVVLIEKNKPEWQKGKINGVGGKVEPNESFAISAMVREFEEETGVETIVSDWLFIDTIDLPDVRIWVFASSQGKMDVESKTNEKVGVYKVNNLPKNVLSNVPKLIKKSLEEVLW
jgi:8-oxo-dGTP diphosphatase